MTVHFVGAGPGAADLLTLRALRLVRTCGVVVVAGSLVPPEVLTEVRPDATVVDTRTMDLDAITALLVQAHADGHDVARLHSGDPSVYSAVAEQARRLDAAGVPWAVVPGVPAFAAAAALLRTELTVPGVGQTVVLTRVAARSTPMPPGEDLATLGAGGGTLVVHLAAGNVDQVVAQLVPVRGADCPAAVVAYASQPQEQVLRCRLADLETVMRDAGVTRTAVIVVGQVLAPGGLDSYLYSAHRPRHDDGTDASCTTGPA